MQNITHPERFAVDPSVAFNREGWSRGYESQPHEYDYWIDEIEGEIPAELNGTFLRNGPGLLDIGGQSIAHPFDGDGMINAIAFHQGRAHYRNRYVRTQAYLEEQQAQKILYRGVFGTQKPGGWFANAFDFQLKNIANTNILYWGNKLLALWEGAEPHRLDVQTLETIGCDRLNGLLQPGDSFAAHPRIDPTGNNGQPCLVNFSIKPGLSSTITLFEFDQAGQLLKRYSHSIPGFCFIHDFAITPNYCIFFQNPVTFNPIPFVLGMRGVGECIKFHPQQPTKIIIIPRHANSGQKLQILETQSGFVFHHANAFEQDGDILIDSICYDSFPEVKPGSDFRQVDFDALAPGQLWRFQCSLTDQTVQRQLLESCCCEFPYIHPQRVGQPYRYLFMGAANRETGNAPLQALLKIDWQTGERQRWSAAPDGYVSEPIFIPHPGYQSELPHQANLLEPTFPSLGLGEDYGWVLSLVYDSGRHRSEVVILPAQNLHQGPIARLHLKHHVPYGLHGSWVSEQYIGVS